MDNRKYHDVLYKFNSRNADERDKIEELRKAMLDVVSYLSTPSDEFIESRFRTNLNAYLSKYNRLIYSELTTYITDMYNDEMKITTFQSNLEKALQGALKNDEYMLSNVTKSILKMYDHTNLAVKQNETFLTPEEKIKEVAKKQTQEIENNIIKIGQEFDKNLNEKVNKAQNNIYSQLISIVAIFVSISFVMFGGMTLMNNLFDYKEMKTIPLFEMLACGSLIGIIMVNVVFAFMQFVLRITDKIKTKDEFPYSYITKSVTICLFIVMIAAVAISFVLSQQN